MVFRIIFYDFSRSNHFLNFRNFDSANKGIINGVF